MTPYDGLHVNWREIAIALIARRRRCPLPRLLRTPPLANAVTDPQLWDTLAIRAALEQLEVSTRPEAGPGIQER